LPPLLLGAPCALGGEPLSIVGCDEGEPALPPALPLLLL